MSALAAWDVVPLHAPARDRSRLRLVPSAGPELKLATRPAPLRLTHAADWSWGWCSLWWRCSSSPVPSAPLARSVSRAGW